MFLSVTCARPRRSCQVLRLEAPQGGGCSRKPVGARSGGADRALVSPGGGDSLKGCAVVPFVPGRRLRKPPPLRLKDVCQSAAFQQERVAGEACAAKTLYFKARAPRPPVAYLFWQCKRSPSFWNMPFRSSISRPSLTWRTGAYLLRNFWSWRQARLNYKAMARCARLA